MTVKNYSTYSVLEAVKRAGVTALRKGLNSNYLGPQDALAMLKDQISMEYPERETQYPGVWVRFSFSQLQRLSLDPTFVEEGTSREFQLGSFKGRMSFSILALSSKDRDQIAGALIHTFLFGRESETGGGFQSELSNNDYINITPQEALLTPGGQSETIGAPWDPNKIVYEDSYSLNIQGEFASNIKTGELVPLKSVEVIPEIKDQAWV